MSERLLGLRAQALAKRHQLPPRPVVDYAPDAYSGLDAPGGIPMSWEQLRRYKSQKMAAWDRQYPKPENRQWSQKNSDPHYTELKR